MINDLGIPRGSGIEELCAEVSRRTGRPIRLAPVELESSSLHGLWIATSAADLIVYQANTSRAHQEHIIAHELSHILCEHGRAAGQKYGIPLELFPDLSPDLVQGVLQRSGYCERDEQEAELMASLLLTRARRRARGSHPPLAPEAAAVLARVENTVGHPRTVA
ncbi:toxin [Streptomyces sp. NPDC006197]|uniref:toxin n=1 Tax=Streptomyces sp. NPDC006197 TaxID=3156685 RepID=UPI0033B955C8